jgi:hypothetical protein
MKRIYTLTKLVMVVTIAAFIATGCRKSQAQPERGDIIKDHPVYATDSTSIGTISITEAAGGEARVSIQLNTGIFTSFRPPYQPILENSEPISYLNLVDPSTGISETSPVQSMKKDITVSYDLLMFTRDLKLRIEDGDHKVITVTKLR